MFIAAYIAAALIPFAVGLWLIISPASYFAFLDRMTGGDLWSRRSGSWNPQAMKWRALGVAVTLFGLFMIVGPPLFAYFANPEQFHREVHTSTPGPGWGIFVVLLLFLILGISFVVKPLAVLDRLSPRKLSTDPDAVRLAYKVRLFGGLLLIVVLGFCLQLLRHFLRS